MISSLKELRAYLRSVPYINFGGCAIAAAIMYKWIKERYPNADIKLLYMYSCTSWNYDTNQEYFEGKQKESASGCSHAAIMYKGIIFDCEKTIDHDYYPFHHNASDFDFLHKSLNCDEWNSCFDRSNVPAMENKTGIKLNLVD